MRTTKFNSAILKELGVNDRQVRVIASTPTPDRVNDVVIPLGCVIDQYRKNPIVLANHNPDVPIARAEVELKTNRVEALVTFPEKGISKAADEWCGLVKSGIVNAVSIGYEPLETEPRNAGGLMIKSWSLLELSFVSVPCNPESLVVTRAFGGRGFAPSRSTMTTPAERDADIAALHAKGEKNEGDYLRALQGSPNLGPALREVEERRVLSMSARMYGTDPHAKSQAREREINRLRRGA